jgi:hypothetical protein
MGGGAIEPTNTGAEIERQRAIQREVERAEEARSFKPSGEDGGAMQAGARK